MHAPSQTAAASSKLMPAGMCATGALSRMQTNSAWAPKPLTPKTRSPTSNSVTAAPTASTSPANSMPRIRPLRPAKAGEEAGEERLRAAQAAVRPVDRRRVDPDEELVVLGDGPLDVFEPQHVRRAVAVVDDGPHALPSSRRFAADAGSGRRAPHPPGAEELRGLAAGRAGLRAAPGRDHPAVVREEAAAEVRAVELHAPDGLVDGAQLGEGERRADERGRDAPELELDADALDRVAHDRAVVERELDLAARGRPRRERGRHAAASVPATTPSTSRSTARYATVTTFIRGSRPGSP